MWQLPYDTWSVAIIVACAAALALAAINAVPRMLRLILILLVATALRVDASWQRSLHAWDERFHALVAKRLVENPMRPVLFPAGHAGADSSRWETAHIWLHKPPLALWSIAASYAAFGVNEFALRLPSVVWGVGAVGVTYLIGATLFAPSVGLLASAFHAVNGFLVSLVAGRRVADHVDTLLIFLVEVAALIALTGDRRGARRTAALCGVVTGLAVLTKSMPGLLPLALLAVAPAQSPRRRASQVLLGAAVAAIVALPWFLYTRIVFPTESTHEWAYTWQHLTHTLEGQGGAWWSYFVDAPRYFGELLPLPILWFAWLLMRRPDEPRLRMVAVWLLVPYAVFSAAATKLPNLVMIAAPTFFVISGAFWIWLRERTIAHTHSAGRLVASSRLVALSLLLVLPARHLLEPTGPLETRARHPKDTRMLREVDATLRSTPAAIFNAPDAVTCMFYVRAACYERLPTLQEVETLRREGVTLAIIARDLAESDLDRYPGALIVRPRTP